MFNSMTSARTWEAGLGLATAKIIHTLGEIVTILLGQPSMPGAYQLGSTPKLSGKF